MSIIKLEDINGIQDNIFMAEALDLGYIEKLVKTNVAMWDRLYDRRIATPEELKENHNYFLMYRKLDDKKSIGFNRMGMARCYQIDTTCDLPYAKFLVNTMREGKKEPLEEMFGEFVDYGILWFAVNVV
jgi:hypothetical protein